MSAVMDAYKLLKEAKIEGINNIYPNMIPPSKQETTDCTDILITDVIQRYTDFGSDIPTTVDEVISLNIFYGLNADTNFEEIEENLVSFFYKNYWFVTYSAGHTIDPDTKQTTKILQFQRKKQRSF